MQNQFNNDTARNNILQNLHKALQIKTERPFSKEETPDFYMPESETVLAVFTKRFEQAGGRLSVCSSDAACAKKIALLLQAQQWQNPCCRSPKWATLLQQAGIDTQTTLAPQTPAGITPCIALVAQTGSILVTSGMEMGRALTVFPPVHIVVAYVNQIVYDIEQALNLATAAGSPQLPSLIGLITGPARTADIEKTLVLGAHGPKAVYLFLIEAIPAAQQP